MQNQRRLIVITGGAATPLPSPRPDDVVVIAADSGYDHARISGWHVDHLVGDLDSISDESLADAEHRGVAIDRHPSDKDATDLELALDKALAAGAGNVDLYGGEGGELGHLLGVATLICADRYAPLTITWHLREGTGLVVDRERPATLTLPIGTRLSLVAVTDATGVTSSGVAWVLDDEDLSRGTSRGLSNTTTHERVTVSVDSGTLLVITEGLT